MIHNVDDDSAAADDNDNTHVGAADYDDTADGDNTAADNCNSMIAIV